MAATESTTIHSFSARSIDGREVSLADYAGQVLLIVNVASECGFTPQYAGLEKLYREYREKGFAVLGFPCNQFGCQEPGDSQAISQFCAIQYDVTFPLFEKIEVNGPRAHPLYAWLKGQKAGILGSESIKWNFSKFLVGRDGRVIQRLGPTAKPESLRKEIERALAS
jgi:glutathione peroxidase